MAEQLELLGKKTRVNETKPTNFKNFINCLTDNSAIQESEIGLNKIECLIHEFESFQGIIDCLSESVTALDENNWREFEDLLFYCFKI